MSKYNFDQKRSDYLTPRGIIRQVFYSYKSRDKFDCDVCCTKKNIPALNHFINGKKDGLKENWYKFNWCNPPYKTADKWVKKAHEEQLNGNTTVMLIPARTETKYWHDYILDRADVKIEFLRKGIRFINPDTNEEMGVYKNALALVTFIGRE